MSLTTRCPACRTAFGVAQDQLKVSAGWVRCGRCSEVFNALESLFDLEREPLAQSGAETDAQVNRVLDDLARHSGPGDLEPPGSGAAHDWIATETPDTLTPVAEGASVRASESSSLGLRASESALPRDNLAPGTGGGAEPSAVQDLPSFIARADRAARWHRPWVRALLGLSTLALLAGALAQLAIIERDWVAVQFPETRAWLEAACEPLACRIEPLRRIERLAVESTGLTRVEGASMYRLSVVLRNRAEVPLLLPAIELTLNDAQGQLIARRVVRAAEVGATQATIAAGAELPLQTLLSAGDQRPVGYTIEIFYP